MWGPNRFLDLVPVRHPIIQAPMIGPKLSLTISVAEAGGLGSLACAALTPEGVRAEVAAIRARTAAPLNLNFFCHVSEPVDARREASREAAWRETLAPYYAEYGLDPAAPVAMAQRTPFDGAMLAVVVELRPAIVSFHFGLPDPAMLDRLRTAGCRIFSSATTVREARWLEERGVDAIIAQGPRPAAIAGCSSEAIPPVRSARWRWCPRWSTRWTCRSSPQAASRMRAASRRPSCSAPPPCRSGQPTSPVPSPASRPSIALALRAARDEDTVITDVLTGKPARGLVNRIIRESGPLRADGPAFPGPAVALQPLRVEAERRGSGISRPSGRGRPLRSPARCVPVTSRSGWQRRPWRCWDARPADQRATGGP